MVDAVVIGGGHNGLVAANLLADAGWSVVVLEAAPQPGGAVRSAEVTAPGFVTDLFSAFYPLGVASPVLAALELEHWGLRWVHAPDVLAHPLADGRCALLSRDVDRTATSVDGFASGDGDRWRRELAAFRDLQPALIDALFRPFPPVGPGLRLARTLGVADALRFARFAMLPVRRHVEESFDGMGAGLLFAGNALHTDLGPDSAGGAVFGWLLCMLGQTVGFPVPEGGSGRLVDALVARLRAHGGRVECQVPVERVVVRNGRAVAVEAADGTSYDASRAVIAAIDAPQLLRRLVGEEHLPARLAEDLRRFQWDNATVKVDWALSGPIPWRSKEAAGAGTVHVGGDFDELTRYSSQLALAEVPAKPFVIVGQMTTADPTRSPAGTESAWGYTHVPHAVRGDAGGGGLTGRWDEREVEAFVARMENQVEAVAPGFRDLVIARHVSTPPTLEAADRSLVDGAVNGGTAAIHQQLFFRPVPGLGRPELPIKGLYLGSSSAHPGGGVHGGPGANAARAALADAGRLGPVRTGLLQGLQRLVYR